MEKKKLHRLSSRLYRRRPNHLFSSHTGAEARAPASGPMACLPWHLPRKTGHTSRSLSLQAGYTPSARHSVDDKKAKKRDRVPVIPLYNLQHCTVYAYSTSYTYCVSQNTEHTYNSVTEAAHKPKVRSNTAQTEHKVIWMSYTPQNVDGASSIASFSKHICNCLPWFAICFYTETWHRQTPVCSYLHMKGGVRQKGHHQTGRRREMNSWYSPRGKTTPIHLSPFNYSHSSCLRKGGVAEMI